MLTVVRSYSEQEGKDSVKKESNKQAEKSKQRGANLVYNKDTLVIQ